MSRVRAFAPASDFAATAALACLACGRDLDVHQPDAGDPHRMLATCESCGAWHLVEGCPDAPDALLVLLPGADALLAEPGCRSAVIAVR